MILYNLNKHIEKYIKDNLTFPEIQFVTSENIDRKQNHIEIRSYLNAKSYRQQNYLKYTLKIFNQNKNYETSLEIQTKILDLIANKTDIVINYFIQESIEYSKLEIANIESIGDSIIYLGEVKQGLFMHVSNFNCMIQNSIHFIRSL